MKQESIPQNTNPLVTEANLSSLVDNTTIPANTNFISSASQPYNREDPQIHNANFEVTLIDTCMKHPSEKIKYYCRDDSTPLCPECVVEHARHDFIMANESASRSIKDKLGELCD